MALLVYLKIRSTFDVFLNLPFDFMCTLFLFTYQMINAYVECIIYSHITLINDSEVIMLMYAKYVNVLSEVMCVAYSVFLVT